MGARDSKTEEVVYNRIQLLRTERGWSRQQLAEMLKVHYQTIGYLERGEYAPSLHLSLRIAALFGLPVDAIFSLEAFRNLSPEALLAR
jgi:DNA-binding XRE family transcriptional regulator